MANKLQCLSPSEIMRRLVDAGVTPTSQRLAIAQYVLCEADHPTAEQVEIGVKAKLPMVSKATVYNTLGKLVEVGLLRELRSPREESLRYDGNIEAHHHFIDRDTGEIVDISFADVEINNIDNLKRKFKIENLSVTIEGSRRTRG